MLKCVFCSGRTNKGVHDVCWKEFKGFMLSDKVSFDTGNRDEAYDEPSSTDQGIVSPKIVAE
jgi:hypothetical protein